MITSSIENGVCIVRPLPASIDARNSKAFRTQVEEAAAGSSKVVVDLSQVSFMDSSALGVLIPLLRQFSSKGGDLRLCSMSQKIQVLFEVTRLYKVFSIWPDTASAVGSFEA